MQNLCDFGEIVLIAAEGLITAETGRNPYIFNEVISSAGIPHTVKTVSPDGEEFIKKYIDKFNHELEQDDALKMAEYIKNGLSIKSAQNPAIALRHYFYSNTE